MESSSFLFVNLAISEIAKSYITRSGGSSSSYGSSGSVAAASAGGSSSVSVVRLSVEYQSFSCKLAISRIQ